MVEEENKAGQNPENKPKSPEEEQREEIEQLLQDIELAFQVAEATLDAGTFESFDEFDDQILSTTKTLNKQFQSLLMKYGMTTRMSDQWKSYLAKSGELGKINSDLIKKAREKLGGAATSAPPRKDLDKDKSAKIIDINSWSEDQHPQQLKTLKSLVETITKDLPANRTDSNYISAQLIALNSQMQQVERAILEPQQGLFHQYENKIEITDHLRSKYLPSAETLKNALLTEWKKLADTSIGTANSLLSQNINSYLPADATRHLAQLPAVITSLTTLSDNPNLLPEQKKFYEAKLAALRAQEPILRQKESAGATSGTEAAELRAWESNVRSLQNAIDVIDKQVDLKKIKPHSNATDAKGQTELQAYEDALNAAHTAAFAFLDISRYTSRPDITAKIEELAGRNRLEGRYGYAKKKIQDALDTAKMARISFLKNMRPGDMKVDELVEAARNFYITGQGDQWTSDVKNQYFLRNHEEKDVIKRHLNDIELVLPDSENDGDSHKKDWAADYNKVIFPLGKRGVTLTSLFDGLMFKPKRDGSLVTDADVQSGNLEIDLRTMDLWDYIVGRIKGKKEFDGIPYPVVTRDASGQYHDATGKYIPQVAGESPAEYQARLKEIADLDQDFSYRKLVEYRIPPFEAHLRLIFKDIPERKLNLLIRFYKTFGAKTVGYQPHLMRAVTRGHGFAVTETSPSDESKFINPFALIMYNATRYADLKMARYMGRFSFVPQHVFVEMIKQANPSKAHTAEEVWHIMELFRLALWDGEMPPWIKDAQKLFEGPNPEINIDGTIFPTMPEFMINVARVEQQKRDMLQKHRTGALTDQQFISQVKQYVQKYEKRGYASGSVGPISTVDQAKVALRAFGQNKIISGEVDSGQYLTAADRVDQMFKFFEKPMKGNMDEHESKAVLEDWMSRIIGKAKLVPGDHQLLFAPFTCEVITSLCNAYVYRNDRREVNKLFAELMVQLKGAGGIPDYSKKLIFEAFGGDGTPGHEHPPADPPRYLTRYTNYKLTAQYRRALWLHHNSHANDPLTEIQKSIPVFAGNSGQDYTTLISPYEEHLHKDEDTTKK